MASSMEGVLGGQRIKVTKSNGSVYEAVVHTIDTVSRLLVLRTLLPDTMPFQYSLRFIPIQDIVNIEILELMEKEGIDLNPMFSEKELVELERQNVREVSDAMATIGVNVTLQVQQLFDALNKTMKCRWKETSIIVWDAVKIDEPYAAENCIGKDKKMLERVQKVLEGEKQKMEWKN